MRISMLLLALIQRGYWEFAMASRKLNLRGHQA